MASIREPVDGVVVFSGAGSILAQFNWIFHAGLTIYDEHGNLQPRLAQRVPSIEAGDWKVAPDGSMEVTWKLKPGLKWHDGAPLTAEDFVFGIQVARDPALPLVRTGGINLVSEVSAPDAETLVVRWTEPYFGANEGTPAEMPALPRHIIGDLYRQGDPILFTNNTFWTKDWVGAGPYKMGEWVPGSHTEALAYDDYVLGRPKIDRIVVRYILDTNAIIASVLSGDLDLVTIGTLKGDDVEPLQRMWEPQGNGKVIITYNDIVAARLNYRNPSYPWVQDKRVRHALMYGLERQEMADTFSAGSRPPDLYLPPDDPVYKLADQRGFPRYPFNVQQADRLMADAGWIRGPDNLYQNAATGQPFYIEVRIVANAPVNTRRGEVLSQLWKRAGFGSELHPITTQATNRPELKATAPGVFIQPDSMVPTHFELFQSKNIATAENRWSGINIGAYNSPEFDRRFNEYLNTLEVEKRRSVYADLQRWMIDELNYLPLYYDVGSSVTVFRRGVSGPTGVLPTQVVGTWNVHTWEMD
jgi:peptide/nickel transport system substrate-binding protein